MILDTEALDLQRLYVYDIGLIVARLNDKGIYEPVSKSSFIIKQVYDNKPLFETAYYSFKRPLYVKMMKGRKTTKKHYGHVMRYIESVIKAYGIKRVYAYNSDFDKKALQFTADKLKTRNTLQPLEFHDIMAIANRYIHDTAEYKEFCKTHGLISEKGYYKMTAETTYRFMKDDNTFIEQHTGLDDCNIELDILNESISKGYDFKQYRKRFFKA
jgi:hypothetical protein